VETRTETTSYSSRPTTLDLQPHLPSLLLLARFWITATPIPLQAIQLLLNSNLTLLLNLINSTPPPSPLLTSLQILRRPPPQLNNSSLKTLNNNNRTKSTPSPSPTNPLPPSQPTTLLSTANNPP